jgi:hypothetical protein
MPRQAAPDTMGRMTDPTIERDPEPGARGPEDPGPEDREPGDRRPAAVRLAVPPSQRYVRTARATEPPGDEPSEARGFVLAALVAAFCGAILVVLGGAFDFTAGLIVVAFFLGRLTAVAMKTGAGGSISTVRRLGSSVLISLIAVLLAQLGLWAWAAAEGGVLGPVDFVAQTYGVLVLLELLLAGGAAWLTAS